MKSDALKILLIQDKNGDTSLVADLLKELGEVRLELQYNINISQSLDILKENNYDAVIFDIGTAHNTALDAISTITSINLQTPVIVLSSANDEELGLSSIKYGAHDFLIKSQYTPQLIVRSLNYAIERTKLRNKHLPEKETYIVKETEYDPTFEDAALGMVHISPNKKIVRTNKKLCEMLGYTSGELLGKQFSNMVNTETMQDDPLDEIITRESPALNFEAGLLNNNGNFVQCYLTLSLSETANIIIGLIEDLTDWKAREEKFILSETFLSEAQELAHLGNYHLLLSDEKMHWSEETFNIMNWPVSDSEPGFDEMLSMIHPEDRNNFISAFEESLRSKTRFDIEYRIILRDSTEKYLHCIGEPVTGSNGEVVKVYGTLMDVTQRKKAESELKYSHQVMSGMFDSLVEAVFLVSSQDFLIKDHNKAAEKIFGYTAEEFSGQSLELLLENEQSFRDVSNRIKRINGEGFCESELRLKRKNSSVFSAEVYIRSIEDDGHLPYLYVSVVRDITERKLIETALKQSEQRLSTIFKEIPSAVTIVSFNSCKYVNVNNAFETITGYNREEVINLDFTDLEIVLDGQSWEDMVAEIRQNGAIRERESTLRTKSGEIKTGLVSSVIMEVVGEEYLLTVITDITDRKKANEQVKRYVNELQVNKQSLEKTTKELAELNANLNELNSSKDKLFSIVAHDLKSPFAALLGFSEFLTNNITDLSLEEIREFTNRIYHSLVNVFRLIENLLQWSRLHSGRIEFNPDYFSVKILSKEVVEVHKVNASNKKISIINNIEDESYVFADRDMIEAVMRNLVSNAIKFTPSEGMVIINTFDRQDSFVIEISDTGIGIPPEDIPKIFTIGETFKKEGTEREKGTGLGLILCKEFVEKNGGKIWIESKLGAGSKFSFSIPKK